jgi:UDP-N-acetylglucosamine:LPS N-acetylglucosamine transferase
MTPEPLGAPYRREPPAPAGDGGGDATADLLLVCSTGGHLVQLLSLRPAWECHSRLWVTFDKTDARSLLRGERLVFAHGPTNRSVVNLLRNLGLGWRVLRRSRPRALVTTGAGVAVPLAWLARLRGVRVVYVESFTRIAGPSLTCRLVAPVADRVYVQWPDMVGRVRRSRYAGNVFARA